MVFLRLIRTRIAYRLNLNYACTHALCLRIRCLLVFFAGDADGDASSMWARAVFPEKDALPGSQVAAAAFDGDRERGQGQDRPDVRRHIIGAFAVVLKRRIAVGRQIGGELFQIAANGRIGVLADDQRGARVVDEKVAKAADDLGSLDGLLNLPRELIGAATAGLDTSDALGRIIESPRLQTVPGSRRRHLLRYFDPNRT